MTLPQIKLKLKKRPMGTMARRYTRPVIGTFFLESSMVVVRAIIWVISVANARCHVVREIADECQSVASIPHFGIELTKICESISNAY